MFSDVDMESLLEQELNNFYVHHAIAFPDHFKLHGMTDSSVTCLQWRIYEVRIINGSPPPPH